MERTSSTETNRKMNNNNYSDSNGYDNQKMNNNHSDSKGYDNQKINNDDSDSNSLNPNTEEPGADSEAANALMQALNAIVVDNDDDDTAAHGHDVLLDMGSESQLFMQALSAIAQSNNSEPASDGDATAQEPPDDSLLLMQALNGIVLECEEAGDMAHGDDMGLNFEQVRVFLM